MRTISVFILVLLLATALHAEWLFSSRYLDPLRGRRIFFMRRAVFLLVVVLAQDSLAQTIVDLTKADLRPLVQMRSALVLRENIIVPIEIHEDENLFISQGGATISTLVQRREQSVNSQLLRGLATSSQLAAFKNALAQSRVGVQDDCEAVTSPRGTTGFIEVIWYGKGTRRSSFRIVFVPEPASLPECPAAVANLFIEFMNYRGRVMGNPDTEVLISR